jgi:exopolysaccharide production protein ExoQ
MSPISVGIPSHLVPADTQAVTPSASRTFLAIGIVLISLVYTMPLNRAWMVSVEENYGAIVDDLEVNARDGSWARRGAMVSLGLFGLIGLAMPGGRKLHASGWLALAAIGCAAWCTASIVWATEPRTAFTRLVSFGFEVLAALAIAKHFSPRQFVVLAWVCTLSWMSLGFLAELSHDAFYPWDDGYRFSGLFHPNTMGAGCALLMLASLYLAWSTGRHRALLLSVAAAAMLFTLLTGSRAALGGAFLTGGLVWLGMTSPRKAIGGALTGAFVLGFLLLTAGGELLDVAGGAAALGRGDQESGDLGSLTGRVPLWNELLLSVAERPIAGFGFNSFWTSERIAELSQREWGDIPNGHSVYIDMVLSIGIVGAILFFAALFGTVAAATAAERKAPKSGYGFIAMAVLFCLVNGFAETTLGISWFLQLFTLCGVAYMAFAQAPQQPTTAGGDYERQGPIRFGSALRWEP